MDLLHGTARIGEDTAPATIQVFPQSVTCPTSAVPKRTGGRLQIPGIEGPEIRPHTHL